MRPVFVNEAKLAMHSLPFDKPGKFWRGNVHTHSTVSDGHKTPEDVCRIYRESGYDFLVITDHFMKYFDWEITDTRSYRSDEFTTLIGAELHAPKTEFGFDWHILAVGLPLGFAPVGENETAPQLVRRALRAGAFVAVAHPEFYHLTETDVISLGDEVHGIEILNATSTDHNDKPGGWYMVDLMCERGRRYSALATDDAHFNPDRTDSQIGWIMVKSETLSPESLLEAMKQGHFYSSTGPQIHDIKVIAGEKVIIRCSPVNRVFVTGSGHLSDETHGHGLTEVVIPLTRTSQSPFIRITIRDESGKRAWTNPIWFDEV